MWVLHVSINVWPLMQVLHAADLQGMANCIPSSRGARIWPMSQGQRRTQAAPLTPVTLRRVRYWILQGAEAQESQPAKQSYRSQSKGDKHKEAPSDVCGEPGSPLSASGIFQDDPTLQGEPWQVTCRIFLQGFPNVIASRRNNCDGNR